MTNLTKAEIAAVGIDTNGEYFQVVSNTWDEAPDRHEDCRRQARAAVAAYLATPSVPTHRHKKRGSEYVLIGIGKMQAENWTEEQVQFNGEFGPFSIDMREVAIYRSVDDGSLWVRPREEFEDGRFETLSALRSQP